jgi:hypothetical protein
MSGKEFVNGYQNLKGKMLVWNFSKI